MEIQILEPFVGGRLVDRDCPNEPTTIVAVETDGRMLYVRGEDFDASLRLDIASIEPLDDRSCRVFDCRYGSLSFTLTLAD